MFSRPLPPTCAALARVSVVKWTCLLALPLVLPAQPIPTIPAIPTIQPSSINSSSPSAVFKLAINASLSQLKAQIQVSKKAFFDDLKTYETAIHDGQLVTTWTSTLHESCVTFQIAVRDAAATADSDIATAGATILDDLASGGPLNGVYPNDFYLGGGGLFDKANAAVRAQLEKLYPTITNRLHKTTAIAAKQGAALSVLLRPPAIPSEYYIAPGTDVHFGNRLGLDLLISLNRSAIESDGRVWLGGWAGSSLWQINLSVFGAEGDTGSTTPSSGRWSAFLNDAGTYFNKGNYIVNVSAEDDVTAVGWAFSFR